MNNVEQAVTDNEGLIYDVIFKMFSTRDWASIRNRLSYQSLTEEDLIQEGRLALCRAYDKYDKSKNTEFSTYAHFAIKNAMIKELNRNGLMKYPVEMSHKDKFDHTKQNITSLNKSKSGDNKSLLFEESIEDRQEDKKYSDFILKRDVHQSLNCLSEKEKDIVSKFLQNKNQTEIAKDYNCTRQNISVIYRNALKKLKNELKDYENAI